MEQYWRSGADNVEGDGDAVEGGEPSDEPNPNASTARWPLGRAGPLVQPKFAPDCPQM